MRNKVKQEDTKRPINPRLLKLIQTVPSGNLTARRKIKNYESARTVLTKLDERNDFMKILEALVMPNGKGQTSLQTKKRNP